jgi:cysteinyl-tRNA synthetase
MIHLYNSLTQKKEPFEPVRPGKASIYYCGMTVYDHCHIGHARSWVIFEALTRFFQSQGYATTVVRNITDIDDKIIARANEHGETALDWANKFIKAMHDDERDLGLKPVDHEPRATEYLGQMIALIEKLIAKDLAYVTEQGDVCFSVRDFPDYGILPD